MLLSKAQKKTPIRRQELRLELSNGFDLKNIGFRRRFRRGWLRRSSNTRNTLPANPDSFKKSLKKANSESITRVMMICSASNKRPNSYKMLLSRAQKETPIRRQELRLGLSNGLDLKNIGFRRRFRRGWRG
ncbi:hypothetical protein CDAR_113931 [Caerostris darwini]|uniref:Ribosomal protein S14 n=1 Tax=Caerostris darwini TaxID=1538125 RepID=A0AAV4STK2_9ARAC|nr:hypothetical protein CDAR_113931 [Caerostris darwini]